MYLIMHISLNSYIIMYFFYGAIANDRRVHRGIMPVFAVNVRSGQ